MSQNLSDHMSVIFNVEHKLASLSFHITSTYLPALVDGTSSEELKNTYLTGDY